MAQLLETLRQYVRASAAQLELDSRDEIRQEIEFHLTERTMDLVADGMPPDEARETAVQRFGDVERVSRECRRQATSRLAWLHRIHLIVTGLLSISVLVLFGNLLLTKTNPAPMPPSIHTLLDDDWSGSCQGQVLDDQGMPLANAKVILNVKTWPDESFFLRSYATTTDDDGNFVLRNVHPMNAHYEINIAAFAEMHAMRSIYVSKDVGGYFEPIQLQLPPASGCSLRFLGQAASPISRLSIRPLGRVDADANEHFIYFDSARFITLEPDPNGYVALPWFTRGDEVEVHICDHDAPSQWHAIRWRVPDRLEPIVIRRTGNAFQVESNEE